MKQVRIKFVGMGAGYDIKDNIFVNAIRNKYEIIYSYYKFYDFYNS